VKKTLALVCLLLLPFVISRYLSLRQSSEIRTRMAGRASDEILVGVAWPFAANQDGMDEGLLLAQEEINTRGLLGKRIRLIMRDDRLNAEGVEEARARILAHNPWMVATIGYYDDKLAVRASAIFEDSRLLHIVAGANNTYMTTHGFRYLIRSVLPNDRIARSLARLCTDRGYRNFAMVAEDGPFGEDLMFQSRNGVGQR
jgi:branched-chain amino acid transport system substrate-binding protein